MRYVDGYVFAVPKKSVPVYRSIARKASRIWREHGALEYYECVGEDMAVPFGKPFPEGIGAGPNEVVMFSYIVYESRAHRDAVNAKVMNDARLKDQCDPNNTPFDVARMLYGGSEVLVSA